MDMLLHGVKDGEFEIYHGDTLTNDWDILRETNPAKKPTFDAVVANPPFSYRWEPGEAMAEDMRFKGHGVAPKSAADFAFLLHGLHYLKDEGVMAIILPHGVLFRGGAEERIRRKLLDDGHIDTVIGLPANLFYSTGIPVCILVLRSARSPMMSCSSTHPSISRRASDRTTCRTSISGRSSIHTSSVQRASSGTPDA